MSEVNGGSGDVENPPKTNMNNKRIDTSHVSDGNLKEYRVNESAAHDTMNDRMIEFLADKNRLANKEDLMQTNNTVMMIAEVSNWDKLLADYMYINEAFEAIVDP